MKTGGDTSMSVDAEDVIDWQDFESRCLNDAEFITQMLGVFIDNAPKTWQECKHAADAGDWSAASRHAHTLKGSAANMSAGALRTLAAGAEAKAGSHDKTGLDDLVAHIDLAMHDCIRACTQRLNAMDSTR